MKHKRGDVPTLSQKTMVCGSALESISSFTNCSVATTREDIVTVPLLFAFVRIATYDLGCSKNELNTERKNGFQESN